METRARHVLIGAFTLAVAAIAAVSMLWLGNMRLSTPWDHYDVVFEEAVTGLTVGGAVHYSGIQVGEVQRLSLDAQDPRRVIARIRVDGGTPIKTDTTAQLAVTGLTFVAVIQLAGGTPEAPMLRDVAPESPPRILATRSTMQNIIASGEGIVALLHETLLRVNAVLSDRNVAHVGRVIAHIETVTGEVAGRDAEIGAAIEDLAVASRSLRRVLARSEVVMGKVDRLADSTDRLVDSSDQILNQEGKQLVRAATRVADSLHQLIEKTGPTLADVSDRDLSQVRPALAEFKAAARSLRELAQSIEDDPQSMFRGKRERMREREAK